MSPDAANQTFAIKHADGDPRLSINLDAARDNYSAISPNETVMAKSSANALLRSTSACLKAAQAADALLDTNLIVALDPLRPRDRLNQVATEYTYDYAIVFRGPLGFNAELHRLDVTIVPRVKRGRPTALLCGTGDVTLDEIEPYLPYSEPEPAGKTDRAFPYGISSAEFATLHPEEKAWTEARLDKTTQAVQKFVSSKRGSSLSPEQARLKLAVTFSGGGKRSLISSFGASSALYDLGIYDHATWIGGVSGGGWHNGALLAGVSNRTELAHPGTVFEAIKEHVQYSIYADQVDANEFVTGAFQGLPAFYPSVLPDVAHQTDLVFCEGNLKLQVPSLSTDRAATAIEYWSRAVASQLLPSSAGLNRGTGKTLSGLIKEPLLSTHSAPLPVWQVMEFMGDGRNKSHERLWDVTPFDMAVHEGAVTASFPVSLLGSDPSSGAFMANVDEISYILGMTSYASGALMGSPMAALICGEGPTQMCQGIPVRNPFKNYAGVKEDDLFTKDEVYFADAGITYNLPISAFVRPTREADIILAVDNSADWGTAGFSQERCAASSPFSLDTAEPKLRDSLYTCPADKMQQCGSAVWNNSGTPSECCKLCDCDSPLTVSFGCYPTVDVKINALFKMASKHAEETTTLPTLPTNVTVTEDLARKVSFFGCDEVSSKTAIVYVPNRIVASGVSGFHTFRSVMNAVIPGKASMNLNITTVEKIFENGRQLMAMKDPEVAFDLCLACLYEAKARRDGSFMRSQCAACHRQYCFSPQQHE